MYQSSTSIENFLRYFHMPVRVLVFTRCQTKNYSTQKKIYYKKFPCASISAIWLEATFYVYVCCALYVLPTKTVEALFRLQNQIETDVTDTSERY